MSKVNILFLSLILSFACGEDDEDATNASNTIASKWNQYCDAQFTTPPENCPADTDVGSLTFFCKSLAASLVESTQCQTQLDELITCSASIKYACGEGGNVPLAESPNPCESQLDYFVLPDGECINEI